MLERIATMHPAAIEKVRRLEAILKRQPQAHIETKHSLHAGLYMRTVLIPAGVVITGVLVKIPTMLIVSGHCIVYIDAAPKELIGYHVIEARAFRKQAFVALKDTYLTMSFASKARTVEEAERQFTDEHEALLSRVQCPV